MLILFFLIKFINLCSQLYLLICDIFKQGANMWRKDEEFGNQRLSGCNPVKLKLCQAIPKK